MGTELMCMKREKPEILDFLILHSTPSDDLAQGHRSAVLKGFRAGSTGRILAKPRPLASIPLPWSMPVSRNSLRLNYDHLPVLGKVLTIQQRRDFS
jgi:hypothetical protein